jgi:hypothetical protein
MRIEYFYVCVCQSNQNILKVKAVKIIMKLKIKKNLKKREHKK